MPIMEKKEMDNYKMDLQNENLQNSTREHTISSRLLTYSSSLSLISAQFLDEYFIAVCET
jgi:hypothetical protein